MHKHIFTTLIAGTFFAASLVAPAFATDKSENALVTRPPVDIGDMVPLPSRLPTVDQLADKLKGLDLGAILDRDDVREKLPKSVNLPDLGDLGPIRLPEPVELPDLGGVTLPRPVERPAPTVVEVPKIEPAPVVVPVTLPAPVTEATVFEEPAVPASRNGVKEIVAATKADKADILAAHGGDRRAAKAELKAAQMRMVAEIQANNGARGQGKGNR